MLIGPSFRDFNIAAPIRRAFSPRELPSPIGAISSSTDGRDTVRRPPPPGDYAQSIFVRYRASVG